MREKVRSSLTNLTPRENIYNLPNFLTVSRLIAAPVTAYLLVHDHYSWALALFAYAGITDLVDGWLARKWKLQTVAGSVIDPMADKALMIILTVTLAVKGAIPRKPAAIDRLPYQPMLTERSVSCDFDPRPRRVTCRGGHLLPLCLAAGAQDIYTILGLLPAIRRGASHDRVEVQYLPATSADRLDAGPTRSDRRRAARWTLTGRRPAPGDELLPVARSSDDGVERAELCVLEERCDDPRIRRRTQG